jgi:hypothetical protein
MLQEQMTALLSASGQISLEPVVQPTTARRKRAGQIDLLITTHVVQIQGASVSQPHALTVLGNLALLAPTDLPLTGTIQIEVPEQEATTAQIVQHAQTQIALGNLVHLALTDQLLIEATQTETLPTGEQEATTAQTVQIVQHARTLNVLGNIVHQEPIAQSAPGNHVALAVVQTLASLIVTATRSVRTAFHAIALGMRASLALAIRTQTRKLSSKTRF